MSSRATDKLAEPEEFSDDEGLDFYPATDRKLRVNGRHFDYYKRVAAGRLPSCCQLPWINNSKPGPTNLGADLAADLVYLLDLLMGFHTGFVCLWDARWVAITDGRLVARYYARTSAFYINVIAFLPLVIQVIISAIGDVTAHAVQLIYLLRLLRLLRVIVIIRALSRPDDRGPLGRFLQGHISSTTLLVVSALFSLLVLLNLLGCVWWTIAVLEGIENSWAGQVVKYNDPATSNDVTRYLISVYFCMTTMTTIGYGDITPYTNWEMLVALLYMLIGVGYFAFLISVVAEVLSNDAASEALKNKMVALDRWMTGRELPRRLQQHLRSYFLHKWLQASETEDAQFYAQLSSKLKAKVRLQLQSRSSLDCPIFGQLSTKARSVLTDIFRRLAVPVTVFPGSILYSKGEEARHMYVLDEGEMASSAWQDLPEAEFDGPAVIGWAGLFAEDCTELAHHYQTVTALTACHLWQVGIGDVAQRLKERHADVLLELGSLYCRRIERLVQQGKEQGWDGPRAVARQRLAIGRLENLLDKLRGVVATYEVAATEQEQQQREEVAAGLWEETEREGQMLVGSSAGSVVSTAGNTVDHVVLRLDGKDPAASGDLGLETKAGQQPWADVEAARATTPERLPAAAAPAAPASKPQLGSSRGNSRAGSGVLTAAASLEAGSRGDLAKRAKQGSGGQRGSLAGRRRSRLPPAAYSLLRSMELHDVLHATDGSSLEMGDLQRAGESKRANGS
ncbi:hypothetical protein N2152v2_005683 [Parachlorella kessleri]